MPRIAVIGGGPAGLSAAEAARAAGADVDVYESKSSVGRKFLLAGKGGLNLTHSEALPSFVARFGSRRDVVAKWLAKFDNAAVRAWAHELGIETFVGSSGRVFPTDMKAAPLLRAWVHRLRSQGVRFHVRHRCVGIDAARRLKFATPNGEQVVSPDAVIFALGGGSWPQLGSDGRWVAWFVELDVSVAPLEPSNCGFEILWTPRFKQEHAGSPVKSVKVAFQSHTRQGEFVITEYGVEGSVIYGISAELRCEVANAGSAVIKLDLLPDLQIGEVRDRLAKPRKRRTLTEHLRRSLGIEGVKAGLIYECIPKSALGDPNELAAAIKSLPLRLLRARPIDEAISSAGGVRFAALNDDLMIEALPGCFCAGEMIDWDAPTGGYLLTASMASGRVAGCGAAKWLRR